MKIALRLISIFGLLGALILFVGGNTLPGFVTVIVVFSFFLISQFYDNILLKLNPNDNILILE